MPRLHAVIFDGGGTLTDVQVRPLCEGLRDKEIPNAQQVAVDVTPDGVTHELLDILDGWHSQ